MNYRVIDDSISNNCGLFLFKKLITSNSWRLDLSSDDNMSECYLPGCRLIECGHSTGSNSYLEGCLTYAFYEIAQKNSIAFSKIDRILCNANYPMSPLHYHEDNYDDGIYRETLLLYLTPEGEHSGTMIADEYVEYKFLRSVIFNSSMPHTATTNSTVNKYPRISVGFMYTV